MYTYNFDNFPYVDKPIIIPENSLFYRGISDATNIKNLDVLRKDIPIYLGSHNVATAYSFNENDKLYIIKFKKDLKLLDIRKAISLLPIIINTMPVNDKNKNLINYLKVTLGITNIHEQINLINIPDDRKNNMINFANSNRLLNSGVRMPITNMDAVMIVILKKIFSSYYDGIISPKLNTPFEPSGYSHEEIIIFDTNNLEIVNRNQIAEIIPLNINSLLDGNITSFKLTRLNFDTMDIYVGGKNLPKFIDRNEPFYNKKWMQNITKRVDKAFKNKHVNPDLWNHTVLHVKKHLDFAEFKKV